MMLYLLFYYLNSPANPGPVHGATAVTPTFVSFHVTLNPL